MKAGTGMKLGLLAVGLGFLALAAGLAANVLVLMVAGTGWIGLGLGTLVGCGVTSRRS